MAIKLHLNVGDSVRNINKRSDFQGMTGVVKRSSLYDYAVTFANGMERTYGKHTAHVYLEKIEPTCPCQQQVLRIDLSKIEERVLANPEMWAHSFGKGTPPSGTPAYILEAMGKTLGFERIQVVHDEIQITPTRRTLKKVRRNILTGRTQDDYVRDCGYATGVTQFNKRGLGLSTGQAMRLIGEAIVNPGSPVRLWDVDHAITDPQVKAGRHQLNKTFVALVESLIEKNKLVGITFDMPKQYMTFNPIVTEETYVETH